MKLFLELQLVTLLASGVLLGQGHQFEAKDQGPYAEAYRGQEAKSYNLGPEPKAYPVPEPKAPNGPELQQGPASTGYQGPEPVGYRGPEPKPYQGPEVKAYLGPEPKTNQGIIQK